MIGHSKVSFYSSLIPLCTVAIPGQHLMNNAHSSANRAFTCRCFSNYLTTCNSMVLQFRLEVIKKHKGGMIHRLYFLILDQQRGLMWYCSQSWEQISLVKNQYLAFFTLLILLPSLPLPQSLQFLPLSPVAVFPILRTKQQRNLHTLQWKLSLSCIIISPPTHHPSWPFLSFPLRNGLQPELSGDLRGAFSPPFPPRLLTPHARFLSARPIKKQRQQWQGPRWCQWLGEPQPAPSQRCELEARPSPLISTDFPMSNKSFSQRAKPLGLRQSRNSTLSAADIKASFTVKH